MYYWYSSCWRLYQSCIRLVIVGNFKHIYQESHGHKGAKQDSGQQNNFGDNSRSNTFDPTKLKKNTIAWRSVRVQWYRHKEGIIFPIFSSCSTSQNCMLILRFNLWHSSFIVPWPCVPKWIFNDKLKIHKTNQKDFHCKQANWTYDGSMILIDVNQEWRITKTRQ